MSFTFRGEPVELTEKCITFSGSKMIPTGHRFGFHRSTLSEFNVANDEDLCHRYSFSAMTQLLCILYNERKCTSINTLIYALFPYYNNDDRQGALNIYEEIVSGTKNKNELEELFNELLYFLNNSISNLRGGKSSWNRSIGEVYDPVSWRYDESEGVFYITDNVDVYMLHNLHCINISTSTLYFYTAKAPDGTPIMYSSNNPSQYKGIDQYDTFYAPIYIISRDNHNKPLKIRLS